MGLFWVLSDNFMAICNPKTQYHMFGRVIFWFPFHLILPYAVFYNSEFIRTRPDDALNAKTMNVRGNRSFFFVTVFLSWMA